MKVIIIGGTSGMGLAAAKRFGQNGGNVVIAGRDPRKLEATLQLLGDSYTGYSVDATSENQLKDFYAKIGKFDHLILSLSGAKGAGIFSSLNLDDLRAGFEAKFWANIKAAQNALPYILPNGSITFITAASARMANPGISGLAAINGAIESMIPILAAELAPIRVNGISPGVVDTPWWKWQPQEQRQASFAQYAQASLVGRVGQPEDIAQAIHAIATNGFITGQILVVDGGLSLKA